MDSVVFIRLSFPAPEPLGNRSLHLFPFDAAIQGIQQTLAQPVSIHLSFNEERNRSRREPERKHWIAYLNRAASDKSDGGFAIALHDLRSDKNLQSSVKPRNWVVEQAQV
jgi:hypothetical protein